MAAYDIGEAFQIIEEEMIASMSRNLKRHLQTEHEEGLNYSMWQAEQLAALNNFRKDNKKKFSSYFSTINAQIEAVLQKAYASGEMQQEIAILEAIREGAKIYNYDSAKTIRGQFFKINERKLNALIEATKSDMAKAETAMLRMADDSYRKIIYNSQVYLNTGVGTLSQAVDMASKDFLSRGITCIEYANGARVGIDVYSRMALRTAQTRAYLQGESSKRDEWGVNTVIVNRRGVACPKCLRYVGKVFYDDVWGNTPVPSPAKYPKLSEAIAGGLYHPNCKDIHTTYFEDISDPPKLMTQKEIDEANRVYALEQRQRYNERQIRKYKRLTMGSVDPENALKYKEKLEYWQRTQSEFIKANRDVLKRRPELEKIFKAPPRIDHPEFDPCENGHTWVERITKKPTCTEKGEKLLVCAVCGKEKKESIPALGHDYTSKVVAPTCTEKGYTVHTCSRCGHTYKDSETPALGHDWGEWVITRQPTVTEYGRKQMVCKRCGEKKYSTIPKLKAGAAPQPTTPAPKTPPKKAKITMAVPEKAWGKGHAENMRAIMEKAPPEVQRVWAKYEKKIHVYDPSYSGRGAHYSPAHGGIRVNIAGDARGCSYSPKYGTAFHEFGHNIDYLANPRSKSWNPKTISETYKNKQGFTLGQMVKKDWQACAAQYGSEQRAISYLRSNLTLMERFDISDMIEGASPTTPDMPLGSGHHKSYWSGRDNGKEAFAEMFAATVNNPDSLKAIKKVFPNAYGTFLEILEAI